MQEIEIKGKRYGFVALVVIILIFSASLIGAIMHESTLSITLFAVVTICSIIGLSGLKVLRPQEALVLTLFGKYVGTLKGAGFFM